MSSKKSDTPADDGEVISKKEHDDIIKLKDDEIAVKTEEAEGWRKKLDDNDKARRDEFTAAEAGWIGHHTELRARVQELEQQLAKTDEEPDHSACIAERAQLAEQLSELKAEHARCVTFDHFSAVESRLLGEIERLKGDLNEVGGKVVRERLDHQNEFNEMRGRLEIAESKAEFHASSAKAFAEVLELIGVPTAEQAIEWIKSSVEARNEVGRLAAQLSALENAEVVG